MASILNEAVEGAMKTRIMYKCNLSYRNLMGYLQLLLGMRVLKKFKTANRMIYKMTDKGQKFLDAYRNLTALMHRPEVTELESKTITTSKGTMEIGWYAPKPDWFNSEIEELKTRVKRLESTIPKLKFCSTCGKEVRPDFRLCPYCGERLSSKKVKVKQT